MTKIIESELPSPIPPGTKVKHTLWGQPPTHEPSHWSRFLSEKAAQAAKRAQPEPYDEKREKRRIENAVTAFYKQFPKEMRQSMLTHILGSTLLPTGRLELINALLNDKPSPTLLCCDEEVEADFLPILLTHRQSLGAFLRGTRKDTMDSQIAANNAEMPRQGKSRPSDGKTADKEGASEARRLIEVCNAKNEERMSLLTEYIATCAAIRKLEESLLSLEPK